MNYETLKLTILQEKYKVEDKIDEILLYVQAGKISNSEASELIGLAREHGQAENEIAPDAVTVESMKKFMQGMYTEMQEMKTEIGTINAAALQATPTENDGMPIDGATDTTPTAAEPAK